MLIPGVAPGFDSHGQVNKCRKRSSVISLDLDGGKDYAFITALFLFLQVYVCLLHTSRGIIYKLTSSDVYFWIFLAQFSGHISEVLLTQLVLGIV